MPHQISFAVLDCRLAVLCLWAALEVNADDASTQLALRGSIPKTELPKEAGGYPMIYSRQYPSTRELETDTTVSV